MHHMSHGSVTILMPHGYDTQTADDLFLQVWQEPKSESHDSSSMASNVTTTTESPSNSSMAAVLTEKVDKGGNFTISDHPFSAVKLPEIKP
ncbi:hypothetical protein ANCCAN_10205 [Ancylostoma caninum]|uniref:Uncharacterized protein n=1 Tax=Ancylostoma caninum TaxID=29170 RepID=A0A368GHG4_ANCCA|nr:hypothetical protein ANCCAN_10205 [Ancylostoma caninum]